MGNIKRSAFWPSLFIGIVLGLVIIRVVNWLIPHLNVWMITTIFFAAECLFLFYGKREELQWKEVGGGLGLLAGGSVGYFVIYLYNIFM